VRAADRFRRSLRPSRSCATRRRVGPRPPRTSQRWQTARRAASVGDASAARRNRRLRIAPDGARAPYPAPGSTRSPRLRSEKPLASNTWPATSRPLGSVSRSKLSRSGCNVHLHRLPDGRSVGVDLDYTGADATGGGTTAGIGAKHDDMVLWHRLCLWSQHELDFGCGRSVVPCNLELQRAAIRTRLAVRRRRDFRARGFPRPSPRHRARARLRWQRDSLLRRWHAIVPATRPRSRASRGWPRFRP
jgi:hypothetical protein